MGSKFRCRNASRFQGQAWKYLIGSMLGLRKRYGNNKLVCLTSALYVGLRFVCDGFKVHFKVIVVQFLVTNS